MTTDRGPLLERVWVNGVTHRSFTDLPQFARALGIPDTGDLEAERNTDILAGIARTFFDYHLGRRPRSLGDLALEYKEVVVADHGIAH